MKKLNVQKLTLCGVMAALVFVMTYFPKIPVPVTGGYVHLGDGAIFLSVLLLGPLGIPAAAVGSMLSDLIALTGSASAGLILLDGQSGGYYVLAVIDQSRADRAGIEAGDTLLTLNSQSPADLTALDAFFSAQQQPCVITIQRKGKTLDIHLPAP